MATTIPHDHDDRGLAFDLQTLMERRRVLSYFGVAGAAGLAVLTGCGGDDGASPTTNSASDATTGMTGASSATNTSSAGATTGSAAVTTATPVTSGASCTPIPEDTAGPFPGDGSNGLDVLSEDGVVRSDLRSSFGSSTTTAGGVPLTISLTVTDTANGCAPYAGAAVYLWHCDREGRYSMYSDGVTGENYLRGVQEAGDDGVVTFTTIFPACYSGRWPHAHFEVYPTLADATGGGEPVSTSQLALPEDVCATVFAVEGYEQSMQNLSQVSLQRDMVFNDDGAGQQVVGMSGDVVAGYTATRTVPI